MKRTVFLVLSTVVMSGLMTSAGRTDEVPYRATGEAPCQSLLWDTCATPFRDEQEFVLSEPTEEIPPHCASTLDPLGASCIAAVQGENRMVVGDSVPSLYPMAPGVGPGITVSASGGGARVSVSVCNNDSVHCPGQIRRTISVSVPAGVTLEGLTSPCLVIANLRGIVEFCSGGL